MMNLNLNLVLASALASVASAASAASAGGARGTYVDLSEEQGFARVGQGNASNPVAAWQPESGTHGQGARLCHVMQGSESYPDDEKQAVHFTWARTVGANGRDIPPSSSDSLLAPPTGFHRVWSSPPGPHYAVPFSVWDPVCDEGFVSVGQVVTARNGNETLTPNTTETFCVREECAIQCDPGIEEWDSLKDPSVSGNPEKLPGASIWSVYEDPKKDVYVSGCNRMYPDGERPPRYGAFRCLKKSCVKFSPYVSNVPAESVESGDKGAGGLRLPAYPPSGVHLALGYSTTSMSVGWQTLENSSTPVTNSVVEWWKASDTKPNPGSKMSTTGDIRPFTADAGRTWYTHTAVMHDLAPVTRYSYRVGSTSPESAVAWSQVFTFTSPVNTLDVKSHLPQTHVIIGDLGSACAFSLCPACNCSSTVCDAAKCAVGDDFSHGALMPGLQNHLHFLQNDGVPGRAKKTDQGITYPRGILSAAASADMILHVGDYGYNLDSDGGIVGDQFMRNIEQVAAFVPYMAALGNHEDGDTAMAHYLERFRQMPSTSGSVPMDNVYGGMAKNTWYYSWDAGLVHYISMSTEIPFGISGHGPDLQGAQYAWIDEDLAKANKNRHNVPWIIIVGHRSVYCSCDGDCDESAQVLRDGPYYNATNNNRTYSYEDLFFKHGVDLFINGHEHDYERNYPTYRGNAHQSNVDPKATIYIVTGAAGCDELHEPFTRPQPPRSAFRSNNFGFSQIIVHNNTHLQIQQIMTDPTFFGPEDYGRVNDDAMIVQHNHGPFDPKLAPAADSPAVPGAQHESRDHWAQILRSEFGDEYTVTEKNTAELIQKWRQAHGGAGEWKIKEDDMKKRFEAAGLGKTKWEDVRMDGSSDGAVFGDTKPELIPGIGDPRKQTHRK
eukprot:g3010.t1